MKAYRSLADGYRKILHINLQEDKKTALKINILAIILLVIVVAVGMFIIPGTIILNIGLLRILILIAGFIVYMILHELTHAVVMKAVGGGKVIFGFTGMYASAGSKEDYFDKGSYRFIALAPLVLWGFIFGILAFTVPRDWFWVVWVLQVLNVSGSAGDLYVTVRFWRMPASILVMDTGLDMTVYDK